MIDFLSSPFSLVSVGLGVLAIAIIGIVVWILSIDRRTRGMVDSLEQERRKVAEMQVFLSRRGNDGARRAPRAPQSGAAVGARSAAASGEAPLPSQGAARGRSATPHSSQAAAVSDGQPPVGSRSAGQAPADRYAGQQGYGSAASGASGQPYAAQAQTATQAAAMPYRGVQEAAGRYGATPSAVVSTGQSAAGAAYFQATAGAGARSRAEAARSAAGASRGEQGASKPEKQRSRGGRGAVKVPYGEDRTGGAGYAGLDQSSDARARAEQAARIRQQAAREAQMRAQQQAQASAAYGAQAAVAGSGYVVAARGGAVTSQAACSPSASVSASAAVAAQGAGHAAAPVQAAGAVPPSVQTPTGVRYVPSDPNYRPASEGPRVKAHPSHPDGFDGTVRTSDTHGQSEGSPGQTPYDQRGAQRPVNPAEGKPSMPWSTPSEPRGRHAR